MFVLIVVEYPPLVSSLSNVSIKIDNKKMKEEEEKNTELVGEMFFLLFRCYIFTAPGKSRLKGVYILSRTERTCLGLPFQL